MDIQNMVTALIESVARQQAMPDDSYKIELEKVLDAIFEYGDTRYDSGYDEGYESGSSTNDF